jgi:hypothetical protein
MATVELDRSIKLPLEHLGFSERRRTLANTALAEDAVIRETVSACFSCYTAVLQNLR